MSSYAEKLKAPDSYDRFMQINARMHKFVDIKYQWH